MFYASGGHTVGARQPALATVRIGATMPLLNSAIGGVFLAHLRQQLTEPVLRLQLETERLDPATKERVETVRSEVLADGVAATFGGVIPGVTSLAARVFTAGESLPLVVTLVMPARGTTEEDLVSLSAELLRSTRAMSEELGYSPHHDDA
ncbi:IclR family transcriptional regulator domain-containing protein [Streptomyces globisporus]|uniref:IclR family transcriptional regulator domain-containing protein n=1 Tax=Streptomyces globisporus TaxID=1908 RepID=UPI00365C65CD